MLNDAKRGKSAHGELKAEEHHDEGGETPRPCPCAGFLRQPFDGEEAWDGGDAEDKHIDCAKHCRFGGRCCDERGQNEAAGEESPKQAEQVGGPERGGFEIANGGSPAFNPPGK